MEDKIFIIIPLLLMLIIAIFLIGFIIYDNYNLEEMNNELRNKSREYKLEIKKLRKEKLELIVNGG